MARTKAQLNAIGYAYTKKKRDTYRDLILVIDGDLSHFEKSGYATYRGYCKHRGIMRNGDE